ncbi:ABC transporter permease subunit [Candidatus Sumerlaeota bacterium]|nr:ABC transporter permease subunit [Candidatus Sumerlaeota bacterium]
MSRLYSVFKREFKGYFATPVAYVFIVIFLFLTGLFTFNVSRFYDPRDVGSVGQADLRAFFDWHPWLYLFLIPAVAMRLWAEERKSGTIELLLTLPVSAAQAIVGKFLAAWAFVGIALALTFPMVLTVLYLGEPDVGLIVAGYIGSFLMAGAYLAIGECVSALAKNQVVSFIVSVVICLLFVLSGFSVVQEFFQSWAPAWFTQAVSSMSFLTHFGSLEKGLVGAPSLVFFGSLIVGWLSACAVILEIKKAE